MASLIMFCVGLLLFISIVSILEWSVHISIAKKCSEQYGWASYKIFIREFNKYDWNKEQDYYALRNDENNCKFCSGIIKFNNIGMIMKTPIDWFLAKLYVKKYLKNKGFIKPKYNWYKI